MYKHIDMYKCTYICIYTYPEIDIHTYVVHIYGKLVYINI